MASAREDNITPATDSENVPELDSVLDDAEDPSGTEPGGSSAHDLFADVEALIDDGFNYFDAEIAFQKTRVSFVGDRIKKAIICGLGALTLVLLAVFGLVVGLILALTPLITAWGATAVVVGLLLLIAFVMVRAAGKAISAMSRAFGSKDKSSEVESEHDV